MSRTAKVFALFLIIAPPGMANAAPAVGCPQLVQSANSLAATIASAATNYWTHRQNFVNYTFGNLRLVANAKALAAAEKTLAVQLQAPVPNTLANFRATLATARSQNCLSAADLRAIEETATKHARKINFDQFPDDETEATNRPGPNKMPP
jgi:hypothetical protein